MYAEAHAEVGAEEAFTAGLLHDIGKLALEAWDADRRLLASRLMRERGMRYSEWTLPVFPHGHCEVGAALAAQWMLPRAIVEAIACHHCARDRPRQRRSWLAIVALANELAHIRRSGRAIAYQQAVIHH